MGQANQGRVLVIDDDPQIRDVLMQLLEDEGYGVAGATNGKDALELLRREAAPCLILLDLMMPIMNGWEFRQEQQRIPLFSGIPVIVLSADKEVAQHAHALAADSYLLKPVDFDALLALVARHCAAKKDAA